MVAGVWLIGNQVLPSVSFICCWHSMRFPLWGEWCVALLIMPEILKRLHHAWIINSFRWDHVGEIFPSFVVHHPGGTAGGRRWHPSKQTEEVCACVCVCVHACVHVFLLELVCSCLINRAGCFTHKIFLSFSPFPSLFSSISLKVSDLMLYMDVNIQLEGHRSSIISFSWKVY